MTGQTDNTIPIRSPRSVAQGRENKRQAAICDDEIGQLRSELARAERALVRMSGDLQAEKAAKVRELAMVVHGLRNSACSVSSAIDYLIDDASGVLTGEQTTLLHGAAQATLVIIRMVDNILGFSESECGKLTAQFTTSDLVSIASDVVILNQARAERRGVELRTHFELPALMIELDPIKITQVIDNLICNAIKFSEPGCKVDISSGATESFAFISIRDEGPGISPERLKKIFEPFHGAHNRKEFHNAGVGLGLAIAKRILDLHSGTIDVKSRVGCGSEFTIHLPLELKRQQMRPAFTRESLKERRASAP
jgi:signal transduction histidine kinase